jgi:hypothetical protein
MISPPTTDPPADPRRSRLAPWIWLGAAVCWSVAIRVPLILNASTHLDSDLAVDGLTLLDAVRGRWRWHYPGTPYMGIAPVLLSWVQALIWGVNPLTLVSGGTVAYVLVLAATFALAWRVFGRGVATWSLLPLTFASTGTLWLSGRITGGHLPVVAWSAVAWLLLYAVMERGGRLRLFLLGVWCGLGVYLDSLFLATLAGMVAAGLIAASAGFAEGKIEAKDDAVITSGRFLRSVPAGLVVMAAFCLGVAPRYIGKLVDPHDAYEGQLSWSLDRRLLAEHARLLILDCLPRLIAGHRIPGLEADPDPALLGSAAPMQRNIGSRDGSRGPALALTTLALTLFAASLVALARFAAPNLDRGRRAIAAGLLASAVVTVAAFLVNRNIFNSDNYRYLVLLLLPWTLGVGAILCGAGRAPGPGIKGALAAGLAFAVLFTTDTAAWYRRMGWIDGPFRPVRRPVLDPALTWLEDHPEVRSIHGSYWDVYRLSFLTGGRVRGVPFPVFPNRFPEWSADLRGGRPETVLVRPSAEGRLFLNAALRDGGKVLYRDQALTILLWPPNRPETRTPRDRRAVSPRHEARSGREE